MGYEEENSCDSSVDAGADHCMDTIIEPEVNSRTFSTEEFSDEPEIVTLSRMTSTFKKTMHVSLDHSTISYLMFARTCNPAIVCAGYKQTSEIGSD
ncbi:hypothetical protein ACTXT7_002633 [Hymenolepis weldensis]